MSIDRLLQATAKAGGQEMRLIPGRRIVIVTATGEREVQGPEQTQAGIDQLLSPWLTPEARQGLAAGRAEWRIQVPGVGAVGWGSAGSPPLVRHDGEIKNLPDRPALTATDTEKLLWPIAPERNREEFKRRHDTDFAYEIKGLARFRCNFFMDRKGVGGVFRVIPSRIITAEDMGISKEILQLCHQALPRHKVPAAITFVPDLTVAASGKVVRHRA